jgi:CheY-like chemotaxis protein
MPQGDKTARARILIVEDDALVAMMLRGILDQMGCDIVGPAARIERALALAQAEEIDGALLDVNIAGAPVYPVADALGARGVPFLFLTAYGSPVLPERYRNRRTLTKPILEDRLRAAVETDLVGPMRRRVSGGSLAGGAH